MNKFFIVMSPVTLLLLTYINIYRGSMLAFGVIFTFIFCIVSFSIIFSEKSPLKFLQIIFAVLILAADVLLILDYGPRILTGAVLAAAGICLLCLTIFHRALLKHTNRTLS